MDRARIGSLVRARRDQLGLSMRDVAAATGMTHGNVGHIEHGTYSTSVDTLAELAVALHARWEVRLVAAELPERTRARQALLDKLDAIVDRIDERDARVLLAQLEVYEAELPSHRQAIKYQTNTTISGARPIATATRALKMSLFVVQLSIPTRHLWQRPSSIVTLDSTNDSTG